MPTTACGQVDGEGGYGEHQNNWLGPLAKSMIERDTALAASPYRHARSYGSAPGVATMAVDKATDGATYSESTDKLMSYPVGLTAVPGWTMAEPGVRKSLPRSEIALPAQALGDARVLIIDDCTLHRENLATLMAANGAAEVRTAWDLSSVASALRDRSVSTVLLNVSTSDSAILLRSALEISPGVRVIAVGVSDEDESGIVAAAEAGAAGYHTRSESIEDLLELISKVDAGESVCSPRVSAILLRRLSALASQRPVVTEELVLTAREAEILRMLELGLSNREIAEQLCIAVHTVKNHVHSLLTKLGVNTRGQAAALAHVVR
ncbi:hypothetical protein BH11ACT6_BH11ACT6_44360 [soil metagenome]